MLYFFNILTYYLQLPFKLPTFYFSLRTLNILNTKENWTLIFVDHKEYFIGLTETMEYLCNVSL